jgi:uncharacterized membrane protein
MPRSHSSDVDAEIQALRSRRIGPRANRALYGFARHWLRFVLGFLLVYAGLPWVAPVLMYVGMTDTARAIYTLYTPFCHQFAFRSVFLFGEQPFYPRFNVGDPNFVPFETYAADLPEFDPNRIAMMQMLGMTAGGGLVGDIYDFTVGYQAAAREFLGNPQMGYKTAICARDVAIYASMFFFGLLYAVPAVRRRIRPAPLWLYVLLGLGPIGIDGFSQLFGYVSDGTLPMRETLPIFRVLTGALFGMMNVWLGFPYMESMFADMRDEIRQKFKRAGLPLQTDVTPSP